MIPDNQAMAMGGLRIPLTDQDAEARIAEYTCSKNSEITGLIGLRFSSLDQFMRAMRQLGWHIDMPLAMDSIAFTWIGNAGRSVNGRNQRIRIIAHSYGDHVQVINAKAVSSYGDHVQVINAKAVSSIPLYSYS